MFQKSWLILFVSLFLACSARVRCGFQGRNISLLNVADETGDPYIEPLLEKAIFRKTGILKGEEGKFLLSVKLRDLTYRAVGHTGGGYTSHKLVELKGSFSLYRKGHIEPLVERTVTVRDSFYVPDNPNFAFSVKRRALSRLVEKFVDEIELTLDAYFCGGKI